MEPETTKAKGTPVSDNNATSTVGNPSGGWKRWLSSGLSLTVLMTGLFYIQGRMYRHGYLQALGLEESMFSIDTPQALWLAYQGWLSGAVQVLQRMDAALLLLLLKTGAIVLVLLLLIAALFWLARGIDLQRSASERIGSSTVIAYLRRNTTAMRFVVTLPATIAGVLIAPAALLLASIVLMYAFMILCMPFLALGGKDAAAMCNTERSTVGLATLSDDSTPLVLLECSERFCALIQEDGSLRVAKIDAVERVDIVRVRRALPSDRPLPRCRTHRRNA